MRELVLDIHFPAFFKKWAFRAHETTASEDQNPTEIPSAEK